ncbi:MAG: HEAT repeat domain-containing protein [Desulfobacterium sp.]|nr:HEAT repeat domain-containing protein [Desulfobacterium sp.]
MIITSKEQLKALSSKEDPPLLSDRVESSLQVLTPEEIFTRDLYQEHLEEIGFLLFQCKDLFDDMDVNWPKIKAFEKRLDAHLDAIQVGGPPAFKCVTLFLSDDDEDNIFAAAYTLTSMEYDRDGENIDLVIKSLIDSYDTEDNDLSAIYVKALKYGQNPLIKDKLEALLTHEQFSIQATAVEILTYRREGDPAKVVELVRSPEPALRVAAIHFLGWAGHRDVLPFLKRFLSHTRDPNWEKLVLASLQLGSATGLNHARTACQSESTVTEHLPLYIALAGDLTDLNLLISTLCFQKLNNTVVEGIGVIGDVKAIPILIEKLKTEDEKLKLKIAYSLELITGAGLTEEHVVEDEGVDVNAMSPEQWTQWWQANQNRFDSNTRWRRGKPFTLGACIEEMTDPKRRYCERQRAYLELIIRSGVYIPFEADWFIPKQQEAIGKWEEWWAENKEQSIRSKG